MHELVEVVMKPRKPFKRTQKPLGRKKKRNVRKELEALQKQLVRAIYGNDCFTCPAKNLQGSNCQLGHVPWPRSQLSTICKFDYTYTRMQCFKCNIWDKGRGADAALRMLKEGMDVDFMRIHNEKTKGVVCLQRWFLQSIEEYKQKLLSLSN